MPGKQGTPCRVSPGGGELFPSAEGNPGLHNSGFMTTMCLLRERAWGWSGERWTISRHLPERSFSELRTAPTPRESTTCRKWDGEVPKPMLLWSKSQEGNRLYKKLIQRRRNMTLTIASLTENSEWILSKGKTEWTGVTFISLMKSPVFCALHRSKPGVLFLLAVHSHMILFESGRCSIFSSTALAIWSKCQFSIKLNLLGET